ncbi:TonB-dependent receptor [uncultured Sunxiuqinia sp.]|uniref:SusC/RagA family TonB-linked outer membrane protein n=1 Tax=uncultured Sunxiuqinia sp. TaxID=1573825 RepID=UPI00262CB742|nr:TonB-dependent receptor [uncultured Sunxiuqinia sp.]
MKKMTKPLGVFFNAHRKILTIMRNAAFLILFTSLQVVAGMSYSQSTRLSLNKSNVTIKDVLMEIENQSGMYFLYNSELIDVQEKVDASFTNEKLDVILNKLFEDKNVQVIVNDRHIVLTPGSTSSNLQQQKTISGKVTDALGQPLPGVTVLVKGTTIGIVTDFDGLYTLTEVPAGATLVFSFVGMKSQEVEVAGKNQIDIALAEDAIGIEEVVAIGYGTQKKVNLTGSVSAVNADALENRPVTNVSSALQGLMPGATVTQTSGQPGKDAGGIRIRGIGTLNNSNPMYVVDGMVVGNINDIDPSDIASISILKDAASAAIYGSRASNGVILVTTKKGNSKETTLKYEGYIGWQQPTQLLEHLPSWEYAELYNKALVNENKSPAYTEAEIEKFKNGSDPDNYPNTDWAGLFYKKSGFQQSHRAQISGGSDNTTYLISLGYLDQGGIIDNAGFKRYNGRANITTTINKFEVNFNMSFTQGNTTEPTNPYTGDMYQIFRQINRIAPFVPYKYSTGDYGYIADGNPLAWMDLGAIREEKYRKTRGIGNISYEPIKGLKIKEILGYEYTGTSDEKFIKDIQFYNWKTGEPTLYQGPNSQKDIRVDYQTVSLQTLVTYEKTFGKHTIQALGGFSQESSRTDWNSSYRKSFLNNELWEVNAGSADGQVAEGSAYEYSLRSYFGRISYNFNDKYLLEANVRQDGSSRISKDNRWGTFPSFSGAWRAINEPFMENVKDVVSDLKIRAGWGILGNQSIGNYPYQSVLSAADYRLGGAVVSGVALKDGVNTDIKWEESTTTNIGVDLGLFSNKLTFSTDVYNRITSDVLLKLPVPSPTGLTDPYQNAGEVTNKGVEFQLGYKLKKGDWDFHILANAAYNKNEITDLRNDGARIWNGYSFLQEGYPINSFGGYIAEGLFRTQEDLDNSAVINRGQAALGDIKYKDVKKDGKINAEDREFLGSWMPAWTFGTTLSASWKGLDLQLLFQGAAQVKSYVQNEFVGKLTGFTDKPTVVFRDSYDKDTNPDGNFPRPLSSWNVNSSSSYPSSFWVVDGSYLRLKNLQFGYTLPKMMTNSAGLSRVRIYYSGQNLLTFTGLRKGVDPEAPAGARAYYPQVKTNTIGLSVTF